jgi:amino acid adenylation domain-containing protein/non-ribosomal peptide synthase protein (TIGR01720 family)
MIYGEQNGLEIAIIGLAGRFPGAKNVEEYWQNVRNGVETISSFSNEELLSAGVSQMELEDPSYVRRGGVIEDIDLFDAAFFGYSPREAELLDPQQRLFLECTEEALENAGYDARRCNTSIGIYAGAGLNTYLLRNLYHWLDWSNISEIYQAITTNDKDFLASRAAYKLNLRGPALVLQTACSTSLVAVHMATQGLLSGECSIALAGGVTLRVPHKTGYRYQEGSILAPDGHCRAFDAGAQGTVASNGIGMVVLKRLEDALAERDHIYAVIKGSSVNNDGAAKVGYTAPGVQGQARVIRAAQLVAGVDVERIGYIETHGTGTALGDPIEIAALTEVFRAQTTKKHFCALGSVKTNIGHTDTASGIAGLIKTIYSLQEHVLLPSLHFQTPNPALNLEKSPFYVNNTLREWKSDGQARCAGVSSFGIGGTNAHVILEEGPELKNSSRRLRPYQLLVLSARSEQALGQASSDLAAHLRQHPDLTLADAAYTLQTGRPLFQHRRALVCQSTEDAASALETGAALRVLSAVKEENAGPVTLLFPGQGAQHVNMGRDLYQAEPVFRAELDRCAELLIPYLGSDLREIFYPAEEEQYTVASERLQETWLTQPALFALEYALAQQWLAWGIHPTAMIGHSIGEYVAACLAGVFSLENALRLVATRGRLMQQLPEGAMLALPLPEQEIQTLLTGQIGLAAVNTHTQCVVAGPTEEIEELSRQLQARGIDCQRLHTSHAFHSALVEPVLSEFTRLVASIPLSPPQIPYISNVTGTWITPEQATDPHYWSQHMRQPVRFASGILEVLQESAMVLLEVGPGRTLSAFARVQDRSRIERSAHTIVSSLKRPAEKQRDDEFLMTSLARLWLAGVSIAWDQLHAHEEPYRLPLPTYPFERKRYWIDPPQRANGYQQAQIAFSQQEEILTTPEKQEASTLYARPEISTSYVAPRNQVEKTLVTLWQELLGISQVGIYDPFFELGGHSLLATQLVSRLRSDLQLHLPLRAIFEATTIAELSAHIEEHAVTQAGEEALFQPVLPIERAERLPASYSQQRLWFLWQMEPGAGFFNIPLGVYLQGPLHLESLKQALQELIKRHEILRTTFITRENELEPVIASDLSILIENENLQAVPDNEQAQRLQQLATAQVQQAFDLEHGPLLRVTLFKLAQEKSVLLITMHHMISDGWSFGIFMRELLQLYQAFQSGQPSPLEPLAIQYVDFAAWQREWLQGPEIAKQLAYWQQQLGGTLPALELPTDHPRPAIQSYRGAHLPFQLPDALTRHLNSFSQQEHITMFMLLLAAFQVVCARHSGQEDILIGAPIANRRRTDIEKLIGCFINTLVIRSHLTSELTFKTLLEQVREKTLEAYANQDVPFEQLVEALQPERDLSRSPIFQVMFMLQNVPLPATESAGLHISALDIDNGAAQFDLTLVVNETDQHLTGFVEYNRDLFEVETIRRIIEHWQCVLSSAVEDCTRQIADLPLMTEAERLNLAVWNTTQVNWDEPPCVPQMFTTQVERSPDALALIWGNHTWTYNELNRAANRVAHALQARGIGHGHLVGVCLERSAELVVALLGVLKAGAAYVPLDPTYPQERLAFMLTDSHATALLTQETLAEHVAPVGSLALISLPLPDSPAQWEQDPEPDMATEAIAYMIYTSGSTGKPKGVMIPQKALRNCLISMATEPGMTALDRVLAVTSFSFDIAALELLLPLVVGASVVIASQTEVIDAQALRHLLDTTQATFMQATPATWHMLLSTGWQKSAHLKILCGGEALPQALARQLCLRSQSVWNMYGPTETTIWSTTCQVHENDNPISLGHPIANTSLYLLDARGKEVPVGVAGELFIGGDGLAHGYWQRPALTAERFVPDPFSTRPGARLYRTGDLVRRTSAGRLIYLNRLDFQVKVRGHRIELGEIETKLAQHPTVRECVLAVSAKEDKDARLIAFLILEPDTLLNRNELRHHLAQLLPEYMLPSHFLALERWPLTPNNKIDRKALLQLELPVAPTTVPSAPANAIEEILVESWAKILHRDAPGTGENFFDLGGHSLLATQLLGQVHTLFALDIPLRSLFEYPTIKEFARLIEQGLRQGQGLLRPPLLPVPREQVLLPSYAQQRLWFLEQLEPDTAAYHIPVALSIQGPLDAKALEQSLGCIVQRHESLRTTFATHEGQIKQSIISPLDAVLRLSRQDAEEQNLRALINEELLKPFNLSCSPLLRATLFQMEQEHYVLVVIMHHIASDGPSCTLFVHELIKHYTALVRGETPVLPALSIQYPDFAFWQRKWLSGAVLDAQLDYWKHQLAAIVPLELPTDRPRRAIQTFRGADITFTLPQELTSALQALSKQEGVTLFMTLLSAFQILLHNYTGQEDITIGTPITNRNQAELDELIGLFINTLVLRINLAHNPPFSVLLAMVRETCLEAYAHQDLPFEQIVDALQPERDLSRSPLFQAMFVLQHVAALDSGPLQASLFELKSRASKCDLTLEITVDGQTLRGRVEYATDLFNASSIERLIDHWQIILAACVDNPSARIATFPQLTAHEYQLSIEQWNATRRQYTTRECLHQLIEGQVERTPQRLAVIFEKEQLSYRELNQRANQLAHYLQTAGVGPDVLVGVCLERSLELIISLLAILKAGGAYVPFDPSYPAERLAFMLEDSGVSVLLSDTRLLPHLPGSQARILSLDTLSTQLASLSEENPATLVQAENLAYMIYTSGSTGKPKGAMNTHQAICNRLLWMQDTYNLEETDRVLQKTPFSFDVSVWEFFLPLLTGTCLVVACPDGHRDPAYLIQLIRETHITTLHFVPSMLQIFLEEPGLEHCQSLRRVICSGEALSIETQKRFFSRLSAELHNLYGPTEAAVDVTAWRCEAESTRQSVPIGYPIANIQIYLLNEHLQPVPIGVSGELHIGGIGLARGYWQRPGLTAERFIPDPFSQTSGARLYKTGDLARFLPDGAIEFRGRIDHQVKVRGFRIELGEIEAALAQHQGIRECAAVVREDTPGVKRLVAYIVPRQREAAPAPLALRDYLQQRLPDYMVPALFVQIEQLPLSPGGKLDRRALPQPATIQQEHGEEFVPPGTHIEQTLASIWAEVLGLDRVSITDNFFALGGDSILSMQIIARAARANIRLTPRQIFRQQTIEALARVVNIPPPFQAEQGTIEGPVSLTPIQHWFFEQKLEGQHHWNQSALLQFAGEIDAGLLEKAFTLLFLHHDALRLRFTWHTEGWQQINAAVEPARPFFERSALTGLTDEEQKRVIEETQARVQASLDLAHGPLLRVVFFERGQAQPGLLLICIHHLVVDNVSWQILLDDLQIAYQAFQQNTQPHFPPKTTSYQRWAEELVQYAQTEKPFQELDFWLEKNRGESTPLPTDGDASNTMASVRTYTLSLSREETSELQEMATRTYQIPLSDIVLAMLALTFARWTTTDAILIDSEGHGREEISDEIEVSRTVGWFTSIYPVYLQLQHSGSESEALRSTLDRLRSLPQHGFNYGILRYLHADPALRKRFYELPAAEILFNYVGQLDQLISSATLFKEIFPSSSFDRSPAGTRKHLFEIISGIRNGRLYVDWRYSNQKHHPSTVEQLAAEFIQALRNLLQQSQTLEARALLSAQYSHLAFTAEQLKQLLRELALPPQAIAAIDLPSHVQQGMLYETLSTPGSGIHIEQWLCTLTGKLDEVAFRQAWEWALDRHAMLRTGFSWENRSEPLQVTRTLVPLSLTQHDLRTLAPAEQEAYLNCLIEEERTRGFNLPQPPLLHLALFRLEDETYRFSLLYHHIIMDLWCLHVLIKEVLACYQEYSANRPFQLEPGLPYTRYLAWLRQQSIEQAEHFWRKSLSGFTHPTPLGQEGEPASQTGTRTIHLSEQLPLATSTMAKLQQMTRQQRLTLSTLFQGIWALLLSRYSGKDDVLFGITVSGRPPELVGIESMVGLCINTLPLRIQIPAQMELWEWLSELQSYNLDLRQYEYTPAGFIHSWSAVHAGESLYESLLVVENFPESFSMAGQASHPLTIVDSELKGAQTRHTLTILATPGEHPNVGCIYDGQRISQSMVLMLLGHFKLLLEHIASGSQSLEQLRHLIPVEQIPILYPCPEKQAQVSDPPRTPVEQLLAAIWKEVLGLEQIGIHDNFLALGGHSLLATQLIARIRTTFQLELPLRYLFELPTIAGLGELIAKTIEQRSFNATTAISTAPRNQPLPLSFAQQRLWFLDQLLSENSLYNITRALRIQGPLQVAILRQSLEEIVRRHEALRTTFSGTDGDAVQTIHPQVNLAWSEVDVQHIPAEKRHAQALALVQVEAQTPMNLAQGPLMRLLLVKVHPEEYILAVTIHHIVFDVWSEGIFVRELLALYQAFSTGQPSPLASLSIQYADFAVWQRQWLQGRVFEEQMAYWRQQLHNASVLELPTDHPRKSFQSYKGAMLPFSFDKELSTALVHLSQQEGVTLFMTLLTSFMGLLRRYSGQTDIVIGTDIANRTRTELEQLIGFFVNVLILRGDLGGNLPFTHLLQQTSRMVLDAYAHQDLPFEKIIEGLRLERDGNQIPLARVLFVFQNTPWVELNAENLTLTPIVVEQDVTRFELAFFLWETSEGLKGMVNYSTDLFKAATITRMIRHFQMFIQRICSQPDIRLDSIKIYDEAEEATRRASQLRKLKKTPLEETAS